MLDYEGVKKYFADKLAADFAGHGRLESAFYHTIKMVYESAIAESAERIARLEADHVTLRRALTTTSEGNAKLIEQRDELLAALRGMFNEFGEHEYGMTELQTARTAIANADSHDA